jgi:hypothetical protein
MHDHERPEERQPQTEEGERCRKMAKAAEEAELAKQLKTRPGGASHK